jgi:hypothetical protein
MKHLDRVKVMASALSSLTVSVGVVVTLGAALTGMRTLSQALTDGAGFAHTAKVGDTNIGFILDDGNGNWLNGLFTLTSTTQITLTQILTSSASGGPVTFLSASPTVYNGDSEFALNLGLINPHDPGFDIIICAGQSNMVGQDVPVGALDIADPRVFSFGGYPVDTATYQKITQAVDPLRYNYSQASLPSMGNGAGLSPAQWFAKTYAGMIPANRKVLLVPVARSATTLVANSPGWAPGDGTGSTGAFLYENMISQANAAVVAARKMYPNSRVVGTIWLQGEGDADWTVSQINYASAHKALIQGVRTRVTSAANSWCVIMGMIGEYVSNVPGNAPGYAVIDQAHRQVAAEFPRCAYTPGLTGYPISGATNVHYSAEGARILGCNAAAVAPVAAMSKGVDTTAPAILRASVPAASPTTVYVTMSEPLDPNYPPDYTKWTVGGHTVSAAAIVAGGSNNTLALTVNAFSNGEAARTVGVLTGANVRDLAGNQLQPQSGVAITNNVPSAPTVSSVAVSPSAPSVAGGATQQFTATVTGTGSPAQTVTWSATAGSIDSSGLFTAPAATGSTQTITVTATSTVDNTKSGTATVTVAATGTPTVSSVTVSPSTASVAGGATQQFSATVTGTNSPAQTVTWSANGGTVNSSGLFTAPAATGSTQTITVTATSTADGTKSGTATVTVAAVASGTDLQFADFYLMTDTSVGGPGVAPYTYKMGSSVNYAATQQGGTAVKSLAGDGTFTVKLVTVSARQFIGLKSTAPTTNYGSLTALFMAETTGYKLYFPDGNSTTYVTNRIPAENDLVRMTRSGTNVTYAVSSDGGTTWTDIAKQANVSAGTKYLQILGQSNGQFVGPVGTGFA